MQSRKGVLARQRFVFWRERESEALEGEARTYPREGKKERKRRSVNSAESFGLMPPLRHGQGMSADDDDEDASPL